PLRPRHSRARCQVLQLSWLSCIPSRLRIPHGRLSTAWSRSHGIGHRSARVEAEGRLDDSRVSLDVRAHACAGAVAGLRLEANSRLAGRSTRYQLAAPSTMAPLTTSASSPRLEAIAAWEVGIRLSGPRIASITGPCHR